MALVQVRLIPVYRRLSFTPGFWFFAFSYAVVAYRTVVLAVGGQTFPDRP